MVDVGKKVVTARVAVAEGFVQMRPETLQAIVENRIAKGEVLGAARIAGIMAAKRCGELIPLCHGLNVESVEVDFELTLPLRVRATARIHAKTGVEMEALTAVSVAALTIYDMCKAIDRGMVIQNIRLIKKTGGKSGAYLAAGKIVD